MLTETSPDFVARDAPPQETVSVRMFRQDNEAAQDSGNKASSLQHSQGSIKQAANLNPRATAAFGAENLTSDMLASLTQ